MKKLFIPLLVIAILISCGKERITNMTVTGQIKGLKKGKLYLQKMKDTILVSVDSIALNGSDTFILKDFIESPIIYYLTFDANNSKKSILFFGEEGEITIKDNVESFGLNPEIKGSKNQEVLDKFTQVSRRFQEQRLEFVKKDFEAKKAKDKDLIKKLEEDYQRLVKRRVLYTSNFAISNANFEAAPYIALTELYGASFKILDTVNKSFNLEIKNSEYGKLYQEYLDKIKETKEN